MGGPGPVLDPETLGRFLYRTDQVTPDGVLTPAALPTADFLDPERRGTSVGRLVHMTVHDIRSVVAVQEQKASTNKFSGCGVLLTEAVRSLRTDDGRRELCIVDDAEEGFPAHALLRLANPGAYNKGSVRRLRKRLIDLFAFCPARALLNP